MGKHDTAFRVHLPPPFTGMHPVFHVSSLKKFQTTDSYTLPDIADLDAMDWNVQSVSATRTITSSVGQRRQYLVNWAGGGASWCDAMLLHRCEPHIRAYWASILSEGTMPSDALPLSSEELASIFRGEQTLGGGEQ